MQVRSLSWAVALGAACLLALGGCCNPCSIGACPARPAAASKASRNEAALAQRDGNEVPPARTMSEWMEMKRSDLP